MQGVCDETSMYIKIMAKTLFKPI